MNGNKTIRHSRNSLGGYLKLKYGIGNHLASHICKEFGYLSTTPIDKMSSEKIRRLNKYTDPYGQRVLNQTVSHVSKKVKLGTTQGIRMRLGLPVRGQRTHTNRMRARRLNKSRIRNI